MVRKLNDKIDRGEISAHELSKSYFEKIRSTEKSVGGFLSINAESAFEQAVAIDAALSTRDPPSLLAGIPFAVKDNICISPGLTTAGSRLLKDYRPPHCAEVVLSLRASGAIFVGKTNMDEFGMGSTTENSAFRSTSNPWDKARVPGGSSGGSAAAVVNQYCAAALGSDTGGSIRQPASFCGVVGLKPTYGLVSRHGLVAYASSFDCIGPLTSSVEDAAIVLSALCFNRADSEANVKYTNRGNHRVKLPSIEDIGSLPLSGRRFAIIKETLGDEIDKGVLECVLNSVKEIEKLGAVVDIISCPTFHLGLPAYYILALSEASSNLARYGTVRFGSESSRGLGFGPEVKRRILMGSYALSAGHSDAYYKRAKEVQKIVGYDLAAKLDSYDSLITPAAPAPAYHSNDTVNEPLSMFSGDMMTVNVNLAGLPAIVVRGGLTRAGNKELPVGLQFIGRPFGDADLLEVAHIFELCTWDILNSKWKFL